MKSFDVAKEISEVLEISKQRCANVVAEFSTEKEALSYYRQIKSAMNLCNIGLRILPPSREELYRVKAIAYRVRASSEAAAWREALCIS